MKGDIIIAVMNSFRRNVQKRVEAGADPIEAIDAEIENALIAQHANPATYSYISRSDYPVHKCWPQRRGRSSDACAAGAAKR